jgi:natural product precursor
MKKKTMRKKLSLNKETIARLSDDEMSHNRGGVTTADQCTTDPTKLPPCNK